MAEEGGGTKREKKKVIKLRCPAAATPSKRTVVPWVVREDQRLDLGSIARFFGLDPSTMRLSGRFIARGVDLVATSVTWKSLLSFFSARGLPAGGHDADAIVVDGKLCKPGIKRQHDPCMYNDCDYISASGSVHPEDIGSCKKKKLCKDSSGNEINWCSSVDLKRKQCWEEISHLKRLKIHEKKTDFEDRKDDDSGPSWKRVSLQLC